MAQYTLSMEQNPTMPAWFISEDEGEAWDCGDYICFLQKHPPLQIDAMNAMARQAQMSTIPSADSKGFRYLYVLSMFYKNGHNPSGRDSALPAEVMTIEQVNTTMFSGGPAQWDSPVLCSFKPSGHWNSERTFPLPLSKDVARKAFFDELLRRNFPAPSKIGNIKDGVNALRGESTSTNSNGNTGCIVPMVMFFSSMIIWKGWRF